MRTGSSLREQTSFGFLREKGLPKSSSGLRMQKATGITSLELKLMGCWWRIRPGSRSILRNSIESCTQSLSWTPRLDGLAFPSLTADEAYTLEEPFSKEEIKAALDSLVSEKSPGPEGMPMVVYQKTWGFIKLEILEVARELQMRSFVSWRINTTFLTLLPKVEHPSHISCID